MDARITVAQTTSSLPNSESPKVIKLTKPQTDQAVTIHLDGATKLDLSAIGNDNVTFVHAGDRLVILFDNHSTVTIDPFYDSKGLPQADILVELSADRSVSGAEFASLFPITTDQSILPAAGDGGSPASGAHFETVTVGPLGNPGTPLPLLGPENFGSAGPGGPTEFHTVFAVTLPSLGTPVVSHVDEGGLATGNHEPGDAGASETGSLHVNFGSVPAGRSLSFTSDQSALANLHLTSGGQDVTIATTTINGLPALIGFIGNASNLVFEITLDAGPTDGAYTFTLLKPLDHPVHGQEDTLSLPIGFTATDGIGDSVSGALTVQVKDDIPTLHVASGLTEDGATAIAISFGADGPAPVLIGRDGPPVGPISFGPPTVDATIPISLGGLQLALTGTPGDPNHASISITDRGAFDPLAEGQHATLHVPVTLRDGDGDTVVSDVLVDVVGVNDKPIETAAITSGAVFEDSKAAVAGNLSATGTVNFTDIDLIDTHSVTATPQGTGYLGAFTPTVTTDATGGVTGTVGWNFAVADDATDFLAQDQKLTQTYTIKVDDGHGGSFSQDVAITITGTNEAPVIVAATSTATGIVIEDTNPDPVTHNLSATGAVNFTDVDLIDTHSVTATPQGAGYLGTFTPTLNTDSGNGATGSVGWTFTVADDATDFLAQGQTLTQTYAVKVDDGHNGFATQNVIVTITGSNEAPTIVAAATTATGTVTEDSNADPVTHNLSTAGTISFTDVDLTDTHSISFVPQDPNNSFLGTFMPTFTAATDATGGKTGTVGWNFTVADDATDSLAQGQTLTQTYTVNVDDGHGGTAKQDVVVTINGSNEAPVVTADVSTGSLTEPTDTPTQDNSVPGALLTTTGSFTFTDVDLTDKHTIIDISPAGRGASPFGELKDVTIGIGGVVSWTYTIPVAAAESLKAGETLDESFNVTVADNHGGTATKTVTVTTLGTNDFPVAQDDVVSSINGSPLTEDSAPISLNSTLVTVLKANDILDPDHGTLNPVTFGSSITVAPNDFGITATDVTFTTGSSKSGAASSITLGSKFQTLTDGEFVDVILPYTLKGDQPTDVSTANVTFHVAGINDPPITNNVTVDAGSVAAGTPIQVKLTGSDVDGTVASFKINDLPTGGTLFTDAAETQAVHTGDFITASANAATLFFKPNDGGNTTSFHFTAIDNEGLASTAAGIATVNVNHPPVAVNDTFSVSEDGALVVAAPGVLANDHDPDAGDTIHITSINFSQSFGVDLGSPSGLGDFFFNQDGSFQFLPSQDPNSPAQRLNDGQTATFQFVYQIADSHGATSNARVDITIVGHTDVPHAVESEIVDAAGFRTDADWHFTGQGVAPFTFKVTQGLSFPSDWGTFLPFPGNENPDPATGIDPATGKFDLGLGYIGTGDAFTDPHGPLPPTSGPGSTDHIGYSFTDNSGVTVNGQLDLIRIDGSIPFNITGSANGDDLHFLGGAGGVDHLGNGNNHVEASGRLGTVTEVFGGSGNNTFLGGSGAGQNKFHGGSGDDIFHAGFNSDILDGGGGNNQFFVGSTSVGGGHVNHATITGGSGNNIFALNNSDEASSTIIKDYHFTPGGAQDTIDLTTLSVLNLGAGAAAFNNALFGTPLFDPIANGLNFNDFIKLVDDPNGKDVHLEVDPDGTGTGFQFHDVAQLQNHHAADFTDITFSGGSDHIQFHGNNVEITDFGGAGNTTLFSGYSFLAGQTVHETLTGGGGNTGHTIFSFNSTDPGTTATINNFATGGRQDVLDFSNLNLINHGAAFNQALFGTSGFDPTINGKNVSDFVKLLNDGNGKDVHVQVDADGTAAHGFHDVAVLHNYQTTGNTVDIMFANAHQAILHVA